MMASTSPSLSGGDLPFAKELFDAADRLRGRVESAEYKHLVLGLLFLRYVSDNFERHRSALEQQTQDPDHELYTEDDTERADILEDRSEYQASGVFWVPEETRFAKLLAAAKRPGNGPRIDAALELIERENPELRTVLPRYYARSELPNEEMGELVTLIGNVDLGHDANTTRDLLGRTYEYFIKAFAKAEGHRGGEFFTPQSVVRLLVEMLEPFEGRVFDPAAGSCGMFIQSAEFVEAHGGKARNVALYGQESAMTNYRIGRMNLALHGLSGDIRGGESSLTNDQHPTLKADFVLANPPFNQKEWGAEKVRGDSRWKYGEPPDQNANFAWIQHFVSHLAPAGRAGFVMANGSLASATNGEDRIREALVREGLVDCIVACPTQLFFTTQIPVSLWFIDRTRATERESVLFIDARKLGAKISATQREFTREEVAQLSSTYHGWRSGQGYEDRPGLWRAARIPEIEALRFNLNPGRYVGHVEEERGEDFGDAFARLSGELEALFAATDALQAELVDQLEGLRE